MSEQAIRQAIDWCARLTGLPRECFENLSLQNKLDFIGKWYASAVIADQVTLLLVALAMEEDEVSPSDIAKYLGSRETTGKPLGRFNFVAGICSVPRWVSRAVKPLLELGAYRPHLAVDVGAAICKLLRQPGWKSGTTSASSIADAVYERRLSPYQTKKVLRTIESFMEPHPEAAASILEALIGAREQAVDMISGVPDVEEKIGDLQAELEVDSPPPQ